MKLSLEKESGAFVVDDSNSENVYYGREIPAVSCCYRVPESERNVRLWRSFACFTKSQAHISSLKVTILRKNSYLILKVYCSHNS